MRPRMLWCRMCWIRTGLVWLSIMETLFVVGLYLNRKDTTVSTKTLAMIFNLEGTQARQRSTTPHHPSLSVNNFPDGPQNASARAYEFVVAHYNEKLDWLKPIANHSHVYHKGKDTEGPPFNVHKWEKLPNVGREPHTYLHHIIANYDNLADLTVFLQGHGTSVDKAHCFSNPAEFLTNARNGSFCKEKSRIRTWGRLKHFGKWLKALRKGKMRKARFSLGEFYEAVFGTKHPDTAPKCLAGCFSATRDMIRQHPISLYKRAISFIDSHANPEETHYMERLWASMLYIG